ncbi:hypothetical protein SDC9_146835 [bioreactor metagenome]|uniref:Uncharacterized protein n=1 Tax=bioreactor metagenome TaxID=1076179 RepID=A0A645EFV8_9ZZZZ
MAVAAQQALALEGGECGAGALVRAADQDHLVAHDETDHTRQQRIVRAAEDQRVDLLVLQRLEIAAGDGHQRIAGGDPCFDEGHELRADLRAHLHR